MGLPAEKPRRATYADLEAVPPHKVAEIINGVLHVFPRPAPRHAQAASRLMVKIGGPFDLGDGGPGGWHILVEPEIHLGPKGKEDYLAPDLAGWRVERMPELPETAHFALAPDWACEVLSPRTEATDRADKMTIYAREGVPHVWLLDPILRTLEVFALDGSRRWTLLGVHRNTNRVRVPPFEEIELDLGLLWPGVSALDDEETTPAPPTTKPKRARTATSKRRGKA